MDTELQRSTDNRRGGYFVRSYCAPLCLAVVLFGLSGGPWTAPASAQDFFASLFAPPTAAPAEATPGTRLTVRPRAPRSERAFCVRSCDGRYFPVQAAGNSSSVEFCSNLCPAAETRVFFGETIDAATSREGKSYSKIANAFRYRNEVVAGCSCNAAGAFGLAHIRIEDDKTIRPGDLVAEARGLVVAEGSRRQGIVFRPVSAARAKSERLPIVASQ
jgi:hypothetical protein